MTPIDLTADEARAASAGRLTEIVRAVDPQPAHSCRYEMNGNGDKALHLATAPDGRLLFVPVRSDFADHRLPCPFGEPGALLYGREEWRSWVEEHCDAKDERVPERWADLAPWERPGDSHACDPHCRQTYVAYSATPRSGYRPEPDRALITYLHESTPLDANRKLLGPWEPAETMPEWASRRRWRNGGVRVELRAGTWCWVVTLEVQ